MRRFVEPEAALLATVRITGAVARLACTNTRAGAGACRRAFQTAVLSAKHAPGSRNRPPMRSPTAPGRGPRRLASWPSEEAEMKHGKKQGGVWGMRGGWLAVGAFVMARRSCRQGMHAPLLFFCGALAAGGRPRTRPCQISAATCIRAGMPCRPCNTCHTSMWRPCFDLEQQVRIARKGQNRSPGRVGSCAYRGEPVDGWCAMCASASSNASMKPRATCDACA
jgi:hypothetical protein